MGPGEGDGVGGEREMEFVEREWLASLLWVMDSESFLPSSRHGWDLWQRFDLLHGAIATEHLLCSSR